jgi:phosphomannomutase/phosphoglucomutase
LANDVIRTSISAPKVTPMNTDVAVLECPDIPPLEIFKAYDIRGIVGKTLTKEGVRLIGRALGTEARARGQHAIAVGRDGRHSGPVLAAALIEGILSTGLNAIDVGMVATPIVYFAAHHLGCNCAVAVTGSHNPLDYNGLKMVLGGDTLAGDEIRALRVRIENSEFFEGAGVFAKVDVREDYLARIVRDVKLFRGMKIVIDCGNGVAGATAGELYQRLGCEVIELFSEVDGNFPNHHPDPSKPENLQDLIRAVKVQGAELGLAFDGDGDRLGVVTRDGTIIFPDRQLMLYAADVLGRQPGAEIIFDVKCTRNLASWIRLHGGNPMMWKTGHSLIKAKMKASGAPLAGEMSGHTFFGERWYGFDDGQYAGARLLEIVSREADPSALLNALPDALSTPELNIGLAEGESHSLIAKMQKNAKFPTAVDIITLDGLRVEYTDGFGLARASNTTPVIVLRFEADSEAAMCRIQADFRVALDLVKPGLILPF